MFPVSLCWLSGIIEEGAVGKKANLFNFCSDRDRRAEARRHSVSLILRHKATLLLDKSIGLEILIPEGHIPNHKAMVVVLLDGVIERDL